jgi:dipeptidyl aminopeptidase/acylaminoacyl peptidase
VSTDLFRRVCDWSSDRKALLVQRVSGENALSELWEVSLAERPEESTERPIALSKTESVYQCRLSPDEHWIVFVGVTDSAKGSEPALYAVPRKGGTWIRLTDGKSWDDKPRWFPDGKTIYFMSGHGGFYGVWAVHFDPLRGRGLGTPILDRGDFGFAKFVGSSSSGSLWRHLGARQRRSIGALNHYRNSRLVRNA